MPTISLCMIVKNEEASLPRCLKSIRNYVDEIMVVDTGSTDETVKIAKDYGAKVYDHPWENDFSKHRNQSISYATGDWILIMDADEELAHGQGEKIRRMVTQCSKEITKVYFVVKDLRGNEISMVTSSLRLFRNHIGAYYKGVVHNLIIVPEGESVKSDIVLHHYGYALSAESMEKKFQRTYSLLEKQLAEDPNNLYALYNMATLFISRNPRRAIEYGYRLLSLLKHQGETPMFYMNIFYVLASSFSNLREIDKAISMGLEAIKIFPQYVDAYWILCESYFEQKDYGKVIKYGNQFFHYLDYYLNHQEDLSDLFVYSYDQGHRVRVRLGLSYIYADDWARAEPHLRAYLDNHDSPSEGVNMLLGHLRSHHRDFEKIKDRVISLTSPSLRADKAPTPTLSLCMIVKNEEDFLPQCVESVKDWVDEIIIVDTGSTDRTPQIAESYGAKVYHHPWEDDFSKHRNQSISYATGDWILIMDADEVLREDDGAKIREALGPTEFDSVLVTVVNHFNDRTGQSWVNQVRLFRRLPHIFYDGIVHNQLTGYHATVTSPIYIDHYGYDLAPERMRTKFERTSSLLKKRIEEEPKNFRHYHDLAVSYSMNRMFEEAISAGIRAIDLAKETEEEGGVLILWTYFIVASSFLIQKDFNGAKEYALKALETSASHLDSYFVLVMAYHGLKDWARVKEASNEYFKLLKEVQESPARFGYTVNNTTGEAWRVYGVLGDYYLESGNLDRALKAFDHSLSHSAMPFECLKVIGDTYRKRSLWKDAANYYQQAYKEKSDSMEALLGLALAKNRLGHKDEAIRFYERALELKPDSLEALVNLGDLYAEQGEKDLAKDLYEKAVGIEGRLINVSLKLANLSVKKGELEACVGHCEDILKALDMPCNSTLERVSDLADLFLIIGHELDKAGRDDLFREAIKIAVNLKPDLLSECLSTQ